MKITGEFIVEVRNDACEFLYTIKNCKKLSLIVIEDNFLKIK